MKFHKYHALGNDYLVIEVMTESEPRPELIRRICDRHFGLGSDGILIENPKPTAAEFSLRIFNPDGSEAEKSGNGLRIFARYLWDSGRVQAEPFSVQTKGGTVRCQVRDLGAQIFVEMGRARFDSIEIPITGPRREVIGEFLEIDSENILFTGVTVGNPHCVVHAETVTPELACRLGPKIETHPLFPRRTNVQFVKVLDRKRIQIEIWERGAGYTLASGSSSCAAAAASVRLGHCDGDVTVEMPGGTLQIGVGPDFSITMLGPAAKIAEGVIARELLEEAGKLQG